MATLADRITQQIRDMPPSAQQEVLDFVEYLRARAEKAAALAEQSEWTELSLSAALRGMEDEPDRYSEADLRDVP